MIAVVVDGILAAVAIPGYTAYTKKAARRGLGTVLYIA
jgi:Tfp pilus assembly protein PilE